ncbi:Golgi integral membrane protein 4 isoform X3 [Apis cerana]|uniref:Golgi integral membrane protein 4 isoform X3 n=1 Tax=Apis cerana TaxID=7461 RepID=UPI0007E2D6BC|nr:Golgi integral membrane protein 4 isoform X3 [Apis cerana]XP_061934712.1 Golgi integral membrane protein 4 isoform X3 [Apis cerana]
MNGTRLGRGRGGRLAVYVGCGMVVILLVFLYRAATSEMARLQELNVQCSHQQEALAAQLQVIFEYKVRLEKSLAEEKSSNAAVKQELQQRASREKSLRDKDSIEAMQRFNSLQQTYKLLQTEHQDLKEECKKRDQQALEDTNKLETTLRELRSRIRQTREDKEKALEHLKTKFLELDTQKNELEQKYNDMLKNNVDTNSTIEHLRKEVIQLKRELNEAKKLSRKLTSPGSSVSNPQPIASQAKSGEEENAEKFVDQSQKQQMNGNIVPVGPNEMKEAEVLPLPYDLQEKRQRKENDQPVIDDNQIESDKVIERDEDRNENRNEEQLRQVIPPPNQSNEKFDGKRSSSNSPANEVSHKINKNLDDKKITTDVSESRVSWLKKNEHSDLNNELMDRIIGQQTSEKVEEKLEKVQNNVDGILNQILRMI